MIQGWAFIIMVLSGDYHLLQVGPFYEHEQCNKVRQMALEQLDLGTGKQVIATDCFKVVLR